MWITNLQPPSHSGSPYYISNSSLQGFSHHLGTFSYPFSFVYLWIVPQVQKLSNKISSNQSNSCCWSVGPVAQLANITSMTKTCGLAGIIHFMTIKNFKAYSPFLLLSHLETLLPFFTISCSIFSSFLSFLHASLDFLIVKGRFYITCTILFTHFL